MNTKLLSFILFGLSCVLTSRAIEPELPGLKFQRSFDLIDNQLGNSLGTIAVDEMDKLWILQRDGNFAAVENQAKLVTPRDVTNGRLAEIKGDSRAEIQGACIEGDIWVVTGSTYYNVKGTHWPSIFVSDAHKHTKLLKTSEHSNRTAGWICPLPPEHAQRLRMQWVCGADIHFGRVLSICGPSLFGFSGLDTARDGDTLRTTKLLGGPIGHKMGELPPNSTSRIRACALTETHAYFFGVEGTGKTWYGLPVTTIDGVEYKDAVSHAKGYHDEGRVAIAYVVDLNDLGRTKPEKVPMMKIELNESWGLGIDEWPVGASYMHDKLYVSVMKRHNKDALMPRIYIFEKE